MIAAELLTTLNEIFRDQIFKTEGYRSMRDYCVECLGMSTDQAYRRLQAARLMERFPRQVRGMLETGETNLTHLAIIESVVTDTNAARLFEEVRGKSRREVERMARREDLSEAVTRVSADVAPVRKEGVELRAPDHWAMRAMMDDETKAVYDEILDLLTADQRKPGKVLRRALTELRERLLVQKRRKLRTGAKPTNLKPTPEQPSTESPPTEQPQTAQPFTENPPTEQPPTDIPALTEGELVGTQGATRDVPADIARAVFERDNNQCQFVGDSGHRCCATRDLHLHHIIAWAKGRQDHRRESQSLLPPAQFVSGRARLRAT